MPIFPERGRNISYLLCFKTSLSFFMYKKSFVKNKSELRKFFTTRFLNIGGPKGNRTPDHPVMSRKLYQLSYRPFIFAKKNNFAKTFYQLCLSRISLFYFILKFSINFSKMLLRVGCRSFLNALSSICLMRSRVTLKIFPTSSRVL